MSSASHKSLWGTHHIQALSPDLGDSSWWVLEAQLNSPYVLLLDLSASASLESLAVEFPPSFRVGVEGQEHLVGKGQATGGVSVR